jgi:hypothetical protein
MSFSSLGLMLVCASLALSAEDLQIGIMLSAPPGTPAAVVKELKKETGRVFNLPNTQLVWKNLDEIEWGESYNRVVVMRLKGHCTGQPLRSTPRRSSLGLTHISDGQVLPFIEIDCNRIQAVIDQGWLPINPGLLGRALAMVAVHELHHVLTVSMVHDSEGITKSSFSRNDLCLSGLALADQALQRLKKSLRLEVLESHATGAPRPETED